MATKTKPAVGYVRMSTDKQEDSPEQQRAEISKLAKREGYRIVRWYEDHGISGARTHKRPEFRRMIRDAEERGDFKAILCWDQDRFGRFDSIEAGEWVSPLRRVGVELVTVCQGRIDWADFAGRLIYQITQEGKHRFLVDLSRNALRGMIKYAKKGTLLGSATPYGYDRMYFDAAGEERCRVRRGERFRKPKDWSGKLVPSADPQEVETVRWLFQTFANTDRSARSLGVDLNRRKISSPNKKEWDVTQIKNLLNHPVYIGWLTYGRRSAGLYHSVGADGEISPADPRGRSLNKNAPIVVPDTHEALVDKQIFDAVQVKLKARSKSRGGPFRKYLLSGLLRCGHCGGLMTASAGSYGSGRKKIKYLYYKCKRARVSGTCKNYSVRADKIEPELINLFRSVWQSPRGRKSLCKAIKVATEAATKERPMRLESLLAQAAKLEQQIGKGTENLLLLAPADIPSASALLAQWREEREELQTQIDTFEEVEPAPFNEESVLAELDELEEHLTGASIPLAKTAIRRVFDHVDLYWEQVSPRRRELVRAEIHARYPFCLTANPEIRVPSGAKRESNVIRFKPLEKTRVNDVVATLEDLYAETAKPVSARQIGDVVGMQPHQTLAYLHEARTLGGPIPCRRTIRIAPRAGCRGRSMYRHRR